MTRRPTPRLAWLGAAAILVVAALVALAAIVRGDFSETDGQILGSLAGLLYSGGALFAGLAITDRGRFALGWSVAAAAPLCFVSLLFSIWSDGGWEWALTVVLALLATLMLTTALLLARSRPGQLLAYLSGTGAGIAATLSIVAIWTDGDGDGWIKSIAIFWILGVLAFILVPVSERFTRAGQAGVERVLAVLGDVELVASTAAGSAAIDLQLASGEALLLRRRQTTGPPPGRT